MRIDGGICYVFLLIIKTPQNVVFGGLLWWTDVSFLDKMGRRFLWVLLIVFWLFLSNF